MNPTRMQRLGFRVLGSATSQRRLIDFDAAFAAYAGCDDRAEVKREAYLSAFTYGEDFRRHLAETGSTRGYDGPCSAPWLWFDLDGEVGEIGAVGDVLDAVLSDARRLAEGILYRYRASTMMPSCCSSLGARGFISGCPLSGSRRLPLRFTGRKDDSPKTSPPCSG